MFIFNLEKMHSFFYKIRQRFVIFKIDNLKKITNTQFIRRFSILFLIVILTLGIIFIVFLFNDPSKGSLKYSLSSKVKEITFNIPMGKVNISSWDRDYIGVDYHFNQGDFSKNQLEAHFIEEGHSWIFTWQKEFLTTDYQETSLSYFDIHLPINFPQLNLRFYLGYGSMNLTGLDISKVYGVLPIGNITITSSEMEGLIEVGLGDIKIEENNSKVKEIWQSSTGFNVDILSPKGILNLKVYTGRVLKESQAKSIS